jgi:uncharacterized protein YceK
MRPIKQNKYIRMKKLFYIMLIACGIVMSGCSPLTKTQSKAVNHYFQTIGNYADYTRELNKTKAKIRLNRLQLYPESYDIDTLMIEALVKSFESYQKEMKLNPELDSALDRLDNYVNDYFLLTPNGFRVIKILSGGSSLIGSYFGLGNLINSAFNYGKEVNLLPSNAKKVKKHIGNGRKVIDESADVIRQFAEDVLLNILNRENIYIRENYRKFLGDLKGKPDSYDYYSIYNTIFIRHFEIIYNTKVLANQLMESTEAIRQTHNALIHETAKRQRLRSGMAEIQALYLLIDQIKSTIHDLRTLDNNYLIVNKN